MQRIYSAPDSTLVHLAKHVLENEGIECVVTGEHLASAAGGVAPVDAWLELWVVNPYQAEAARDLVERMRRAEGTREAERWLCPDCIEWREGQFSHCWKCGAERIW
jgi:hypothetical protein